MLRFWACRLLGLSSDVADEFRASITSHRLLLSSTTTRLWLLDSLEASMYVSMIMGGGRFS